MRPARAQHGYCPSMATKCNVAHLPGSYAQLTCKDHGRVAPELIWPALSPVSPAPPSADSGKGARGGLTALEVAGLATHDDPEVRLSVAQDPLTPASALDILSDDEDVRVRREVSVHPNASARALAKLALDPDVEVSVHIVSRDDYPAEALTALASHPQESPRHLVALHPNTPTATLEALASDESAWVREAVAENERTPPEVVANLVDDIDSDVRNSAKWAVPVQIRRRFGAHAELSWEAVNLLADMKWWKLETDDPQVQLVRALYPPEGEA